MRDDRIARILGCTSQTPALIAAAYASSTWDKISCVLNLLDKFSIYHGTPVTWPLSQNFISDLIHWLVFVRHLAPSSITTYLSHIKLIHKLRGLDFSVCESFLCKTLMRGAKNLQFYSDTTHVTKKVMTLPLLKLIGHEIAKSSWSNFSKCLIWCACTTAFFGSFRFGNYCARPPVIVIFTKLLCGLT